MKRVAFYTRISLDEDKQKFSLDVQKERLEAYCKCQYGTDWTLYRLYRETASGTTMQRPELQYMLAEAKAGLFDVVVVYRVDRFSRRVHELSMLAMELKSYGVDFKSASEPIETDSPSGMMILQTLGVFAEFEQKSIVQRTKAGMLKKAQTGSWPGGHVPLGYRFDKENGLQIEPGEAAIVIRIFDAYTQGKEGSSAIARSLNGGGYRTRRGNRFTTKGVVNILRSVFYVGRFRWQQEDFASPHEPIVSDATFEAAQQLLAERSCTTQGTRWHNQNQRVLSGLIRCGSCGSRMFGVSANVRGQKIAYYACKKRLDSKECDQDYVRADWIEEQILGEVQAVFQNEALLAEVWEAAQAQLMATRPSIDAEIKGLDEQHQRTTAALQRYFTAFEAGSMAPAVCQPRIEELTTQVRQLDEQRAALRAERDNLDFPALEHDFIHEILTNLRGIVDAVPAPQKKHLLQLLVEKVLVQDRRNFRIWYKLPEFQGVRTQGHLVAPRGLEPLLPP